MRFTVKDSVEDVMSNFKGPKIFYTPSDPNLHFFIEELPDLLNLLLDHKELADEPYSELLSFRQVLREPALTVFTMKEFESQFIFLSLLLPHSVLDFMDREEARERLKQ